MFNRLIQIQLGNSAGFEGNQQKSQGTPRLVATTWVLADLCGREGTQGVVRRRPAVFIKLKQSKIWLCEKRALQQSGFALILPRPPGDTELRRARL